MDRAMQRFITMKDPGVLFGAVEALQAKQYKIRVVCLEE